MEVPERWEEMKTNNKLQLKLVGSNDDMNQTVEQASGYFGRTQSGSGFGRTQSGSGFFGRTQSGSSR